MRGAGRVVFAGVVLLIVGTINIIYGIGALDDANVFVNDKRFVLTNLNTLGWVLIILGVIQLTGGFSLLVVISTVAGSGSSAAASARSGLCCRLGAPTRGGRSASSSSRVRRPRIPVFGEEDR